MTSPEQAQGTSLDLTNIPEHLRGIVGGFTAKFGNVKLVSPDGEHEGTVAETAARCPVARETTATGFLELLRLAAEASEGEHAPPPHADAPPAD